GQMTHLSARTRTSFSVEVQTHERVAQRSREVRLPTILPQITEQVHDRRWANDARVTERQVAHGANELLELADHAGALSGVKRIVRARGELVDVQIAGHREKQLDGHQALEIDCLRDPTTDVDRARDDGFVDRGR